MTTRIPVRWWSPLLCLASLSAQQAPDLAGVAERAVATVMASTGAPGIAIAVAQGERVLVARGFGFADVENSVPVTSATVFRLASISKPIAAVLALQLHEQGRLDLDADVRTLVPEFPAKEWPVTTRQLLAHLGGVRHYRRGEVESVAPLATQRAGLFRFADDPLLHEPGTRYLYSTYGYCLAGAAIEAAAGAPFADLVRERIALPSGATTLQADDARRLIRGRAQGYERVGGELRNSEPMDSSYKLAGGGLCASAADLARFGLALLGGRLLTADAFARMGTVQTTRADEATGYGLGIRIGERDGRRLLWHTGAQSRVATALLLRPDDGTVVVALCNLEGVRMLDLAHELLAAVPRR
ncbi:MAG: beta-lactamase family protein [Planctomycetes bacterium]|nr:beta-lactamase family protein [Planctomycetota bacterium]